MADELLTENDNDPTLDDAAKAIAAKLNSEVTGEPVKKEPVAKSPEKGEEPKETPVEEGEDQEGEDEEVVDIDDIELDVTVDGQPKKATIRELKSKYAFTGALDKRLQEATETKNKAAQQAYALHQVYGETFNRLKAMDQILADAQEPDTNLEELRVKDPTRYLFERERMREIQEKRDKIAQEQNRILRERKALEHDALVRYTDQETRLLIASDAEFRDPEKAPKLLNDMMTTAAEFGYTAEEVASVSDHRALKILKELAKLRREKVQRTKTTEEAEISPKPLLKPSATGIKNKSSATIEAKRMDALLAKAKRSGDISDVAATLVMRRAPRR